jgi:hypothetical protein
MSVCVQVLLFMSIGLICMFNEAIAIEAKRYDILNALPTADSSKLFVEHFLAHLEIVYS